MFYAVILVNQKSLQIYFEPNTRDCFTAAKSFCSGEIYFAAASVLVFDLMANHRFRHSKEIRFSV